MLCVSHRARNERAVKSTARKSVIGNRKDIMGVLAALAIFNLRHLKVYLFKSLVWLI